MDTWIRLGIFALILFSFLRRISKARTRTNIPRPTPNAGTPQRITPTLSRPQQGKKNDFRDVPPPPENPELG
ncbi:MAG: hypothetical protein WAU58_12095 [Terriglobales bacterium]